MYGNETFCLPCPIGLTTQDLDSTSLESCKGENEWSNIKTTFSFEQVGLF